MSARSDPSGPSTHTSAESTHQHVLVVGGNWRSQRKPTCTQGEHEKLDTVSHPSSGSILEMNCFYLPIYTLRRVVQQTPQHNVGIKVFFCSPHPCSTSTLTTPLMFVCTCFSWAVLLCLISMFIALAFLESFWGLVYIMIVILSLGSVV